MKQEIYMAREIETKCIHLEEAEGALNHFGAMAYQSISQQHTHIQESDKVQVMITAACRIQRENIWRRQLLLWKMESMHWHFHQEWQRSH